MDPESKYKADLKVYCGTVVQNAKYLTEHMPYVAEQLYNFLVEYRNFKCNIEHTTTPGSLQSFPVITLTGDCMKVLNELIGDTTYGPQKIMVPIKITLPTGFPASPPMVTLMFPSHPGLKLQQHDYLMANELRIPYIITWNMSSNPPPNIVPRFGLYT